MSGIFLAPPKYVPLGRGLYEVAPGLFPLGHDFGQGSFDHKLIQLDSDFPLYIRNKILCRSENLSKYAPPPKLDKGTERVLVRGLIERLCFEWPDHFSFGDGRLNCRISGEELRFTDEFQLADTSKYRDSFDAIANQIQEDFAIVMNETETDRLGLLHVCAPSHWAPAEKMDLDFRAVHAPIPGIEKMSKASRSLIGAMIDKGPFVRFVWSFVTDERLNHHPEPPPGEERLAWRGRAFDPSAAVPFYLRVERQCTWGFPQVQAAFFFIRVSFVSGLEIRANPEWRDKLLGALESMSPQARVYKGVAGCFDELTGWLRR